MLRDIAGLDPLLAQSIVARLRGAEPAALAVLVTGSYASAPLHRKVISTLRLSPTTTRMPDIGLGSSMEWGAARCMCLSML